MFMVMMMMMVTYDEASVDIHYNAEQRSACSEEASTSWQKAQVCAEVLCAV